MKIMNKKWICVLIISFVFFFSQNGFAAVDVVAFQFCEEKVQDVSFIHLFMIEKTWNINNDYWIDSSFGYGNLLGANHEAYLLDSVFYKQINDGYSLGIGYKYLYDQKSFYNDIGGKLTKHLLLLTVKGVKKIGRFYISGEVIYTPIGFYKYMNENYKNLSGTYIGVGIATSLTETLSLSIEIKLGKENYMDVSNSTRISKVGLQYKF